MYSIVELGQDLRPPTQSALARLIISYVWEHRITTNHSRGDDVEQRDSKYRWGYVTLGCHEQACYTCKNPYYMMHLIQAFIWITPQIENKGRQPTFAYLHRLLFPFEKHSACQSTSHYRSIVVFLNLNQKVLIKSIALYWSLVSCLFLWWIIHTAFLVWNRLRGHVEEREREGGVEGREDTERQKSCLNLLAVMRHRGTADRFIQ